MPLKAAMESTEGQFGYGLTQAAEHVIIKREQGASAKLDDYRLLDLGQNGGPRLARSHRPVTKWLTGAGELAILLKRK